MDADSASITVDVPTGALLEDAPIASGDFDYESLRRQDQLTVRVAEDKIRNCVRKSVETYVEAGLELMRMRDLLKGNFLLWTKSAFGWDRSQIYRHVWVAEHLNRCSNLENFHPRAISLFARKTLPEGVVDKAIEWAESGQPVSREDVQQMIEDAADEPAQGSAGVADGTDPARGDELDADGDGVRPGDPDVLASDSGESESDDSTSESEPAEEWQADLGEDDADEAPEEMNKRPFEYLPAMPADVNDAFEAMKLCILRHKLAGWCEFAREDLLATLTALGELAVAPSE